MIFPACDMISTVILSPAVSRARPAPHLAVGILDQLTLLANWGLCA